MRRSSLAAVLLAAALTASAQDGPPEARLLRFPDVGRDFVAFVYAGDVWRAPIAGGPATRLTSHAGQELFPKISPDGKWIAFSAEYTGTRQVYVMPSWGGTPKQLTYYNDVGAMPPRGGWDYWVMGWTPDGKVLFRANRVPWSERMGRYFVVDPKGGLETPLELPEGGSASLSADGKRIAYAPVDREFRTWKRTMGGRAQDLWLYDFVAKKSDRLTDWKGTDNFPMWRGDTVYFNSDRSDAKASGAATTLNLFAYDLKTKAVRQLTTFTEYDVLWPSLGPDAIVFMNGGWLYRLDLESEKAVRIPITMGTDRAALVPAFKDVSAQATGMSLSPSGARALVEARGELFTVPAKDGPTRNLTNTQGVREMGASWSPDGKQVVYLSDATGEYEIWVRGQDGSGAARQVTRNGSVWRFDPLFSPDGKTLAFGDKRGRLVLLDVATGAETEVDRGVRDVFDRYRFSPDGRWLAYEKEHPVTRLNAVALYSVEQKRTFVLGDGMTFDTEPTFSADGKHLFFVSSRDYNIRFSAFEFNYLYDRAQRVFVTALHPSAPALFPPKSDEEKGKDEKKADGEKAADRKDAKADGKKDDKKDEKKPAEPTRVEAEGFVARTIALPGLKAAAYRGISANEDAVFYVRQGEGDEKTLFRFDLKERKEEKVLDGVDGYDLSGDGKKILWRIGKDIGIADAKANQKTEGKLDLSGLKVKLDLAAEWRQMWDDGWRITRDWFYDAKMHGTDWAGLKKRYGALLPYVANRPDLDFLFGEIVSELEAGHTYVASGDEPKIERVRGGMLGAEFEADAGGRYRIARIYGGENWDDAWRSPLTEPGVDAKVGDLILAIDGEDLTTADNPYRLLENKAGKPVALRIGKTASGEGARTVTVKPVASEQNLRYLDWVTSRKALVEKLSGGKIGYLHLPNTAQEGNRMLQKMFYAESRKPGLVVDDRYNGGGFIPDRMIEVLGRKTLSWWARGGHESFTTPGFAHDGPKVMLANSYSASGGDALPYYFRKRNLGPIVGTRTWGGLIGLSGNPSLVDGGAVQVPTFRIYDETGKWVVENEGVAPDVEVFDLPEARLAGHDPSLEKAVEILLEKLKAAPVANPKTPAAPDMTK